MAKIARHHLPAILGALITTAAASSATAASNEVTVPFNIGVGPTAHLITGPVFADQPVHFGLRIKTFAVIDRETRLKYKNRIPAKYREMAKRVRGEVRYNPLAFFVPSTLYISPPLNNTQMYGLTLKPIGLGMAMGDSESSRFELGVGLLLTYMFMHSTSLPSPTHFLRPGLEARAELELPFTKGFLMSLGWASQLFPPQEVGGSILALGGLDDSIWHIGQAFLLFHFRTMVTTSL